MPLKEIIKKIKINTKEDNQLLGLKKILREK